VFELLKPTNLDIKDAACLHVVHSLQHPTSRSTALSTQYTTSVKSISVLAEWLRQSGCAPLEPPDIRRWWCTPRQGSMPFFALRMALRWLCCCFFSLGRYPTLNYHSGVVATCDHKSECIDWVYACIGIPMQCDAMKISLRFFSTFSSRSVER